MKRWRWRGWRATAGVAALVVVAVAACLWRPVTLHVRAASLLLRFQNTAGPAPGGVVEDAFLIDDPGHPAIRARLYAPLERDGAIVLVPGVHRLGIDEPRLVRFARAIAASGVAVLTPEVRELVDYRIEAASEDEIGLAAHALHERMGAPVGLMGMSFAGGLALLAASDPKYVPDVSFVVAVGAHDDLARVARFFATGEIARPDGSILHLAAHPYGPLVLVYDHIEDFFPPADVDAARDALRTWLWEDDPAARAKEAALSPPSRARMDDLFAGHLGGIDQALLAEITTRRDAMRAASPHERLGGLRAPVFLLHGAGDSVIPATETLWLATDVPRGLLRDVLVSPALVHVELEGEPAWREKWALVHFMAEVLGAASSARP